MESNNNNLLSFVNTASNSIQEALTKLPKKKKVSVRKFTSTRVKRLVDKKPRGGHNSTSTKGKLCPASNPRVQPHAGAPLKHSYTWPECWTSSSPTPSIHSMGISTESIDPELESLLSELESPNFPLSRHGSFESVHTGTSLSTPSCNTIETRVCAGEAFSPYSDYSEDLDSAYCSPNDSARVSYNCSPTNFTASIPDWTTPLTSSSPDWLPPMSSTTCGLQGMTVSSGGCGDWMSQDVPPVTVTSCVASSSIFDYGPPMTPTISQFLEQYNQ